MTDDRWCTCGHRQQVHDEGMCLEVTRRRPCRCTGFTQADGPPAKAQKIDAPKIIELLRARHADDVFVTECKNGPTHNPIDRLLKLDAWVMVKSWAHWATIGYEVKVSRADFEQDQKWVDYLPYASHFYFVCPGGLIRSTDLPENIGLLWVGQNGERLHVKRRAASRPVDPNKLMTLMSYVLMCRSVIVADMHEANRTVPPEEQTRAKRLADQQEWLEQAGKRRELAWMVRGHVRERLADADTLVAEAKRQANIADEFAKRLARMGIVWDPRATDWNERYRVEREIDTLMGALDWHTLTRIEEGGKAMLRAVEEIRRIRDAVATKAAEEVAK